MRAVPAATKPFRDYDGGVTSRGGAPAKRYTSSGRTDYFGGLAADRYVTLREGKGKDVHAGS
jgi:hypothetical protein